MHGMAIAANRRQNSVDWAIALKTRIDELNGPAQPI